MLKNAKHEKFAQLVAAGSKQADAYVEAGYGAKSNGYARVKGSQLAANPNVAARIKELRGLPTHQIPTLPELPGARAKKGVEVIREICEAATAGRSTEWRDDMADLVFRLCILGAIDIEIAAFLRISPKQFENWKAKHLHLRDAINRGRLQADADVAHSLYQRALGYSHPAVKIFMPAGATAPVYAHYTEHYPPDTAAASLWLRNRHQDRWKERRDVNVEASIEHRMKQMTPEQRRQDADELADQIQARLERHRQQQALEHATDAEAEEIEGNGEEE